MAWRLALATVWLALHAPAAAAAWVGSWAASPAAPQAAAGSRLSQRIAPRLADQTIVQTVRLSAGGGALRIRFTNEYGLTPLSIGAARVGRERDGPLAPGAVVTFSGARAVVVPTGQAVTSDPVPLVTKAFDRLRIALYVRESPACTCHMSGLQGVELSPPGDYTARPFASIAPPGASYRAFLSEVDVDRRGHSPVIVAFGDSITDGAGSTLGADHRWPDLLADRLAAAGRPAAVVNAGIFGNRLLTDGAASTGQNALARFDRDVLAIPGATHVIILEGINDIRAGGEAAVPATEIIGAYRQLIARAHARGLKVFGATLTPQQGGPRPYPPAGEAARRAVNAWIRAGGAFDGVIDFDAAVRDPAAPERMRAAFQSGDWLHPSDAGYRAMAAAIDLRLFQ